MRLLLFISVPVLVFCAKPLLAETGDAAAVIQYCGAPTSEHQGVSEVTNLTERDLTYGDVILHFAPHADGWSFLSGWRNHTALTRRMIEDRMDCFHQAMEASGAAQLGGNVDYMDPTIKAQTSPLQAENSLFGIPHLALILFLAFMVLVVYLFLPRRGHAMLRTLDVERMRSRRRPRLERFLPGEDE